MREKTWSPELADKGALLKNHFYWAMQNAEGSEEKLKEKLGQLYNPLPEQS